VAGTEPGPNIPGIPDGNIPEGYGRAATMARRSWEVYRRRCKPVSITTHLNIRFNHMTDIIYIAVTILSFGVLGLFVWACEKF
jgi:hypothetical protein